MNALPATDSQPVENGWLPDTPVEDSVLRRFVHNQSHLNELIASHAGGRVDRTPDVSLADAGSPVAYFNQAVLLRPILADDDPALDTIERFWADGQSPSTLLSVWPTRDLQRRSWDLVGHPTLVARSPGPVPDDQPGGVRTHVARSAEDLETAGRVVADGYPLDEAASNPKELFPEGAVANGLTVRIAHVDEQPAAIGNVFVAYGIVNLCLAATLPATRRRRAWTKLVWDRVADAPEQPALAFTSDDSRPGFENMGFLPLTRLTLWSRPA